jgi:hypothetical protein
MQVLKELKQHVKQVLGVDAQLGGWDKDAALPFFLREAYGFSLLRLMGREVLLMVDRQKSETPPASIRKHMEQVQKWWPDEVVYVREQVAAYNRNRLVQNQIPFVVPGNQLYLPFLAMDLRERFLAGRPDVKKLSTVAQVVALQAVYKQRVLFDEGMTLVKWAEELGYTKMSMTRAFRELRSVLEDPPPDGALRGRALWELLRPFLRSPVRKRRFCVAHETDIANPVAAGDSALAAYTMMAESAHRTVCMTAARWKVFEEQFAPIELEQPEPGCLEVQVWTYDPGLFARNGAADPLSVFLSYENNTDERVEMALEKMLEDVSW